MISGAENNRAVVGCKQTMKALAAGIAEKVIVAYDCEERMRKKIEEAAEEAGAEIVYIDSMRSLGAMYGIDLGASCAGILKY